MVRGYGSRYAYASTWSGATPGTFSSFFNPVTIGQLFTFNHDGFLLGAMYFADNSDGNNHWAHLWPYPGSKVVRSRNFVTLPSFGAQGPLSWQSLYFPRRIPITSGDKYLLSVFFHAGRYWRSAGALSSAGVTVGDITVPKDDVNDPNGVRSTSASPRPTIADGGNRYGIDVIFWRGPT